MMVTNKFICGLMLLHYAATCQANLHDENKLIPANKKKSHGSVVNQLFREVEEDKHHGRKLQTPRYSASYVGEFQHLRDNFCLEEKPMLQAFCLGDITVTAVSDPSIVCTPMLTTDYDGWNMTQCINTCNTNCGDIYDALESSITNGPYGQIFFTCEGEEVADTNAAFIYLGGPDGTCASEGYRNYHVARMGVSCPLTIGGGREYSFDDYFFDCRSEFFPLPSDVESGEAITCVSGANCGGSACNVSYHDIVFDAELPNIETRCVELLGIKARTQHPTPVGTDGGKISLGLVAGAVGGVVIVVLLVVGYFACRHNKNKNRREAPDPSGLTPNQPVHELVDAETATGQVAGVSDAVNVGEATSTFPLVTQGVTVMPSSSDESSPDRLHFQDQVRSATPPHGEQLAKARMLRQGEDPSSLGDVQYKDQAREVKPRILPKADAC